MMALAEELERVREIAVEAGAILLEGYRANPTARRKGAIDLVTDFDLASEARIRERFRQILPGATLVAEEGADEAAGRRIWYADPLDGTTNFAHGHPFFAVSIGLVEDGRPQAGVVHAPALGVTWSGAVGVGAERSGVPCALSETNALGSALVATGFPYDRAESEEDNLREVSYLLPKLQGLRRCGSAALDLCLVADGTYDGYWEQKLAAWDAAAGAAIVLAAGGTLTDYAGRPFELTPALANRAHAIALVATNGPLHPALLDALRHARA